MKALFKKELNYYLNNPLGYITIVLFAIFANFLFVKDIFIVDSASMKPFFNILPWLFLIFIPAISMRSLAEERKQNTMELLLTLPISESEIVMAKFSALIVLAIISLLLTFGLPLSLSLLTKIYYPEILVGYLGQLFLAAYFIALSLFISNQTKNQVVAFLASVFISFGLLSLSTDFFTSITPNFIQNYLNYLSPLYHLQNFIKGVIDFRSVFYFLSFTVIFLFFTIVDLEKRS